MKWRSRTFLATFSLLLWVVLIGCHTSSDASLEAVADDSSQPEPTAIVSISPSLVSSPATADQERLARPPLPANPTQADHGAQIYYESCMACHGDRGQGLTDEWRAAWNPADQNCWQSKCHAANHPQEGFKLPRYIPPVVGQGTLARFQTAADLHAFLVTEMPWQAPGLFDEATYWQLTAFLLRANGLDPGNAPLGAENATQIYLTR